MSPTPRPRVLAVDLARFLAVAGMVWFDMVLFSLFGDGGGPPSEDGPSWLMWPVDAANGRASALFVVLAGMGVALITGRGHGGEPLEGEALRRARRVVWKRALFLFVVGHLWQSSGFWYVSILHFYAFFLGVGILCTALSNRALWGLIAFFVAGAIGLHFALDYRADSDREIFNTTSSVMWNREFWTATGQLRNFFFNGTYPVFPWFAYTLFGIWLARLPLGEWRARLFLVLGSAAVLGAAVGLSFLGRDTFEAAKVDDLFTLDRFPPMPLYVISAASQGSLCIGLCAMAAALPGARIWSVPLVATAQLSLTIYVGRIFIGGGWKPGLFDLLGVYDEGGVVAGWMRVLIFLGVTIPLCVVWRRFVGHGPLEALMRLVSRERGGAAKA